MVAESGGDEPHTLGDETLITAIEAACKEMKKGGLVSMTVLPEYGYGDDDSAKRGCKPMRPGSCSAAATLTVDLELVKWYPL